MIQGTKSKIKKELNISRPRLSLEKNTLSLIHFPLYLGALLFLGAFYVYSLTLDPSLFRNDSPETITACFTLGISHPPGYPVHTLLGRLFSTLPVGNPAMTLNFFSAFLASFGVFLFFTNAWVLLNSLNEKMGRFAILTCCFTGSLCFGFSNNYWSCALAAKGGIYNLQAILELGLILFFQRWVQLDTGTKTATFIKNVYFSIFLFGLGLINHWPTQMLLIPALVIGGISCFSTGHKKVLKKFQTRHLLTGLTILLIVLSPYIYLPLRSHLYPHLNFGAPFTCHRFFESLFRTYYFKTETLASFIPTAFTTIKEKAIYISARYWSEFNLIFAIFSLIGIYFLWHDRIKDKLIFLSVVLLTTLVANLVYLQVLPIEYWHMDDHLLTVNWIVGFLGTIGVYYLFRYSKWAGLSFAVLFPILTLQNHWSLNDQKREFLFYGYGIEALKSMDRGAFYFGESDYDYFSILYLTEVEHKRPDVGLTLTTFWISNNWKDLMRHQYEERFSGPHPIYCCFPNGSFMSENQKQGIAVPFIPTGTIIEVETAAKTRPKNPELRPLNELWERYLNPSQKAPHPINCLLLKLCSYAYLNMAQYENLRGDLPLSSELTDRGRSIDQDLLSQK